MPSPLLSRQLLGCGVPPLHLPESLVLAAQNWLQGGEGLNLNVILLHRLVEGDPPLVVFVRVVQKVSPVGLLREPQLLVESYDSHSRLVLLLQGHLPG